MSHIYTTTTEMFFQLPEYNGKEYILKSKRLLVRLSPDGRLFISQGYKWCSGVLICDNKDHKQGEMYLASLVLDVLRQLYRLHHGYFAYDKKTIHNIYMYNMKQSKVELWKRWCYYVICKVRYRWKGLMCKWKV